MSEIDDVLDDLTKTFGAGVVNENVKHQIKLQAGSDASRENINEAIGKVLGPGALRTKKVSNQEKQQNGTITDTGENKDVGALMNEGFEATGGGGTGGNRDTTGGAAKSQVAAATNSGSNFGSGPGGSINTSNASTR